MGAFTSFLNLYKPGGGSTGLITPDEVADIDKLNQNFDDIDTWASDSQSRMNAGLVPSVAGAAERNTLFPVPVQGNRVFRLDKGVEDIYLAVFDATTNPYGAPVAGWYLDGVVSSPATASGTYVTGTNLISRKGRRVVANLNLSRPTDFGTNETGATISQGFRPQADVMFNGTFLSSGFGPILSWGLITVGGDVKLNAVGIASIRQVNISLSWDAP